MTLLTIVPANITHVPIMRALHIDAFRVAEQWGEEAFGSLMAMPGVSAFVALCADLPVGFIMMRKVADEAEILTLAVSTAYRRQGAGRALLQAVECCCADESVTQLFLEVSCNNPQAVALYTGSGFSKAGIRRAYYPDGADAQVLVRQL